MLNETSLEKQNSHGDHHGGQKERSLPVEAAKVNGIGG